MALSLYVNQNYASQDFGPTWGNGDYPVVNQYFVDNAPTGTTYQIGALMGFDTTTGNAVLWDATVTTVKFLGVFMDEMAYGMDGQVQPGAVNIATADRPSTEWRYDILYGAQGSTTDIDALITAGQATLVPKYDNGVLTNFVKFVR
jgi:hypothetical protein